MVTHKLFPVEQRHTFVASCAGLLLLALGVAACSLLIDKDREQCQTDADCAKFGARTCNVDKHVCVAAPVVQEAGIDAGPETSVEAGADAIPEAEAEAGCNPVHPPTKPSMQVWGGTASLTFAVTHVDLGDELESDGGPGKAYDLLGYDLDNLCSTTTENLGCKWPPVGVDGGYHPSDGVDGRDQAGTQALLTYSMGILSSKSINDRIQKGARPVMIVQISSFSLGPADDQIDVAVLEAIHDPDTDAGSSAGGWYISADSVEFVDGGEADSGTGSWVPKYVDHNAWSDNFKLVAHLPAGAGMTILDETVRFRELIVTATLEPDAVEQKWQLKNGIISGHATVGDVLTFVPAIVKQLYGTTVCTDSTLYQAQIKPGLCSMADYLSTGKPDPTVYCDSTTWAASFNAEPTTLKGVLQPSVAKLCPEETDPAKDSCEKL